MYINIKNIYKKLYWYLTFFMLNFGVVIQLLKHLFCLLNILKLLLQTFLYYRDKLYIILRKLYKQQHQKKKEIFCLISFLI